MGRPLGAALHATGAKVSNAKELRQQARPRGERFEELNSDDEEDGYRQAMYYMDGSTGQRYDEYTGNEQDDTLVLAALNRMAKAKTKGKANVSIPLEELEALQRRHGQGELAKMISPPTTPSKDKRTARSGSLSSLMSGKKKNSSSPAPMAKSNSKAKISRKNSTDDAMHGSPNVLIQGPDGMPMYAQLAQLPAGYAHMPRSRSRSVSQHQRASTPPEQIHGSPTRFYAQLAHAGDGSPRTTGQHRISGDHTTGAIPGRRYVSGPPEIAFSTLRRSLPASQLIARPAAPQHSNSDPNVNSRRFDPSSSSDDQAVHVEVVPDESGYSVKRTPVKDEIRRRRSRR